MGEHDAERLCGLAPLRTSETLGGVSSFIERLLKDTFAVLLLCTRAGGYVATEIICPEVSRLEQILGYATSESLEGCAEQGTASGAETGSSCGLGCCWHDAPMSGLAEKCSQFTSLTC
jgi:hypothetical protein